MRFDPCQAILDTWEPEGEASTAEGPLPHAARQCLKPKWIVGNPCIGHIEPKFLARSARLTYPT